MAVYIFPPKTAAAPKIISVYLLPINDTRYPMNPSTRGASVILVKILLEVILDIYSIPKSYLQNTERSVVQTISNWPLRIKEWADTQPGEINIRSNLKISRTIFLWLAAEVNDRKIINIEDLQNRPPQSTHHLDISHVIYPDRFRAFSFITWGFL